jgi:hypothetical protein
MKPAAIALSFGMAFIMFNVSAQKIPAHSMLTMGGIVTTPSRKASPVFTDTNLPAPLMQNTPWALPETDLPTNYVSATSILFEQGLADPRDCDYRAIEVGTGNVWQGDGGVVQTHGWVLPGNTAQKFAICWNGLVYPAVSVGTNADLEADVMMLETNRFFGWYSAIPEAMSVSQSSMIGIKGCLLLRLGKTDLAAHLWLAQERRGRNFNDEMMQRFSQTNAIVSTNEIKLPEADPYLNWATDWVWAMFDRTICAHERGDEKLALATARQLATVRPQIEAECARRGFKRQPNWDSRHQGQEQPYLTFLGQLPELLTDLERRDREGTHVSIISLGTANFPDQSKRITMLIHDLDLNGARQWSQPGGVNLADDAVVLALIQEGDAAVEPLLDCLEHDQRLTRSVSFGRDFSRGRRVLAVSSAAMVALQTILQAGFSNAAEIHAYWDKYKNLKLEDRWYAILNDDAARNRWQEAASRIVQPVNVATFPGGFSTINPAPTNSPVKLRGEILRLKTNPSITELLTRHALEFPANNIGSYDLSACCQMAEYLAQWDMTAALPATEILSKRASTVMKYSGQQLGGFITKLSLARANAGDPQAFNDYARWIVTTTPEQFGYSISENFEPFKKFPTNAILQSAAEKMFARTDSAWSSLPWKENRGGSSVVDSELVAVPAYRELLRRELDKTNFCGTVSCQNVSLLGYDITNYGRGAFTISFKMEPQPTNGTASEIRWCDWIALALSDQRRIPFFNPFAPITVREKIITKAKAQLLRK